jgi:hypothetical protein
MAICKTCGKKYSRWTTPVSARGICGDCFQGELNTEAGSREAALPVAVVEVTEPRKPMVPIRLSSFIPRSRSKIVFALVMGCYGVTLGFFVSAWARVAHVRPPPRAFYLRGDAADIIALLLVAPIFESLILVAVFELVRRARAPALAQVFVAALFISELHVWPWWPHAMIVLPSFCIQTASYLYWRTRAPWKDAFWILVSIHALNNVIPALSAFAYATRHA